MAARVFLVFLFAGAFGCQAAVNGQTGGMDGGSSEITYPAQGPDAASLTRIAISEIMYHPVLENAADDNHEFVEIFNPTESSLGLGGWKLHIGKADRFVFPAEARIEPRQYLVIAKNKKALANTYQIPPAALFGDYAGQL